MENGLGSCMFHMYKTQNVTHSEDPKCGAGEKLVRLGNCTARVLETGGGGESDPYLRFAWGWRVVGALG